MFGIEPANLINSVFAGFLHPDSVDIYQKTIQYVLNKGEKLSCELKILRNDKSEFYGRIDCVYIHDNESCNSRCILVILSDISKEKTAEEKKKEAHKRLEGLGLWYLE